MQIIQGRVTWVRRPLVSRARNAWPEVRIRLDRIMVLTSPNCNGRIGRIHEDLREWIRERRRRIDWKICIAREEEEEEEEEERKDEGTDED